MYRYCSLDTYHFRFRQTTSSLAFHGLDFVSRECYRRFLLVLMIADICCAVVCWGAISAATAAVQSYSALVGIRVVLGAVEAVFFPGKYRHTTLCFTLMNCRCVVLSLCLVYQKGIRKAIRRSLHRSTVGERIRRTYRCRSLETRW